MRDKTHDVSIAQVAPTDDSFVVKEFCKECGGQVNSSTSYTGKVLPDVLKDLKEAFDGDTCPSHPGAGTEIAIIKVNQ